MPTAEKICVLCGEDCSDRPRTKNLDGQYACKSCVEARRERRPAGADAIAAEGGYELEPDADGLGDLAALEAAAEPAAAVANCPGCGTRVAVDQVLCTSCGFDIAAGKARGTRVREERASTEAGAPDVARTALACGAAFAFAGVGLGIWIGIGLSLDRSAQAAAIMVGALAGLAGAVTAGGYGTRVIGAAAATATLGACAVALLVVPADNLAGFDWEIGSIGGAIPVIVPVDGVDESMRLLVPAAWSALGIAAAFGLSSTNHDEAAEPDAQSDGASS